MKKKVTYRHKVLYRDCDMMGVMNNAVYVHIMEDARVEALAALGCVYGELEEHGFAGPVLRLGVEYKASARFGDEVEVTVGFERYTGARLALSYEFRDAASGKLLATATSEHCFLDLNTGAPVLIRSYYPEWHAALLDACRE